MPRPPHCRRIEQNPSIIDFGPLGVVENPLGPVVITIDEFEALRLADFLGLYQEQAAQRMGVSRPTFSRIVDSARHKVAEALVSGRRLRIEGGIVAPFATDACPRKRRCLRCRWRENDLQPREDFVPQGEEEP